MARFARIDSQIGANRLRVPGLNPFFRESQFGALKVANRRFEAIRANRLNVMKIGFFLSANRFARIAPIRVANRRGHPRSTGKPLIIFAEFAIFMKFQALNFENSEPPAALPYPYWTLPLAHLIMG